MYGGVRLFKPMLNGTVRQSAGQCCESSHVFCHETVFNLRCALLVYVRRAKALPVGDLPQGSAAFPAALGIVGAVPEG